MPANEKVILKLKKMGFTPLQIFLIMSYDQYHYCDLFFHVSKQTSHYTIKFRKGDEMIDITPKNLDKEQLLKELEMKNKALALYTFVLDEFNFCFHIKSYDYDHFKDEQPDNNLIILSEMFSGGRSVGMKMLLPLEWKEKILEK
jgi:hypothetical protein